jgi:methylated-DNA-[protein]-cysteine S-methyltransferase
LNKGPAASTGTIRIGKITLRVVWTFMGVAFVDAESRAGFAEAKRRLKMRLESKPIPKLIGDSLRALARGEREVDVPVDLTWARDYERDVLFAAMRIPWGETRPYRWLAREAHRPLAVRAAASSIARNPLWMIVPCHRVVRADGTIGAYGEGAKGVARKRALLKREGVVL